MIMLPGTYRLRLRSRGLWNPGPMDYVAKPFRFAVSLLEFVADCVRTKRVKSSVLGSAPTVSSWIKDANRLSMPKRYA